MWDQLLNERIQSNVITEVQQKNSMDDLEEMVYELDLSYQNADRKWGSGEQDAVREETV